MNEIYALRYATHQQRMTNQNFMIHDCSDSPMPLDFFIWLIRGPGGSILVDTGFNCAGGERRNRKLTISPVAALESVGVAADSISDVVITHLHYDHAGNMDAFPTARFHIQAREIAFATGKCMCHRYLRQPFDADPVIQMVRYLYSGKVVIHDGDTDLGNGIGLHWIGGHTDGLQVVSVATVRGTVVLASDASHYYANMETENPFPVAFNVGDMVDGWRRLKCLAGDSRRVIPGHDPLVADIYPRLRGANSDVFLLHKDPATPPHSPTGSYA